MSGLTQASTDLINDLSGRLLPHDMEWLPRKLERVEREAAQRSTAAIGIDEDTHELLTWERVAVAVANVAYAWKNVQANGWSAYLMDVAVGSLVDAAAHPAGTVEPEGRSEDRCDRCGGVNPVWVAPNDLWNAAVRTDGADEWGFLCPSCFATVAEARGVVSDRSVWHLAAAQPEADR